MDNKPLPNATKEGQPRWTYAVASILAIATFVWGVVSYFVPKPEAPKPASTPTLPVVSVSGNGNVGIGTMSGGQINNGVAAAATPTSAPRPKIDSQP